MRSIVSAAAAAVFAVFGPLPMAASLAQAEPVAHFEPGGSAGGGDNHGHNSDDQTEEEDDDVDPVTEQGGNEFDEAHDEAERLADGN